MFEFSNKKILPKIRLFLDIKLDLSGDILNQKLQINNNDFDYLIKVMRQRIGDEIMIFNGFGFQCWVGVSSSARGNLDSADFQ